MSLDIAKTVNRLVKESLNFSLTSDADKEKVLKVCEKNLKIFKLYLKRSRDLNIKNCLLSAVSIIKTIRERTKSSSQSTRSINWSEVESAFHKRIRTVCINNLRHIDPISFFNDVRALFIEKIMVILRKYGFVKVWTTFCGSFIKRSVSDEEIKDLKYLSTKNVIITQDCNLEEWFNENIKNNLLQQLEEFQVRLAYLYNHYSYYFYLLFTYL